MFQQDPRCIISCGELAAFNEVSDANSRTQRLDDPSSRSTANKRPRYTSSAFASKFKGVVPQQNGHWGCQIYANHQRIWLGTFKSEKEAAMAYDSAALKLRSSGDTCRNFPVTPATSQEPNFQCNYSTEAVLNMIKDGTYQSRFGEFIAQTVGTELSLNFLRPRTDNGGLLCKELFHKELTPSDVSKLNRLVIPKRSATMHFPKVPETEGVEEDNMQLSFYDRSLKTRWSFRYCYWKSSQSFVFTRGWNRFVRENNLKAKDTISFHECERHHGAISERFYMIDVNNRQPQLQLGCYPGMVTELQQETQMKSKGFMLFGVRIV